MWCHRSLRRRLHTTCQKPKEETPSAKGKGKSRRFRSGKSDGKGRGFSSDIIVEVHNDGSKTQTSHMKGFHLDMRFRIVVLPRVCVERNLLLRWDRHVHEKVNEWETSATLRQSMRVIISEESEIRLSVHSCFVFLGRSMEKR